MGEVHAWCGLEWKEAHSLEWASQLASSFAGKKRTRASLADL